MTYTCYSKGDESFLCQHLSSNLIFSDTLLMRSGSGIFLSTLTQSQSNLMPNNNKQSIPSLLNKHSFSSTS